ncbi:hypothetical protein APR08_002591 [Nocardia amikacinitolerans]|nr:hypothetical protein [Nocardia amikacinitolerans]
MGQFPILLRDQDGEDDGGQPAGPNQPRKAMVGARACVPISDRQCSGCQVVRAQMTTTLNAMTTMDHQG